MRPEGIPVVAPKRAKPVPPPAPERGGPSRARARPRPPPACPLLLSQWQACGRWAGQAVSLTAARARTLARREELASRPPATDPAAGVRYRGRVPPPEPIAAPPLSPAARRLVARGAAFDAHVDAIGRAVDLGLDLGLRSEEGHFDLERARAGGLGAWVVVCWVDPARFPDAPAARAGAMIDAAHALAARRPERFALARDAAELERARASGRIAGVLGIEGGHALEESLATLERFAARGLRVLTLVWNNHLSWIRSCQPGAGAGVPSGLSAFGRALVRRAQELGIMVDLSHAGERSFFDALEVCERPPIASHSGCRALHDHPRNLTDEQLRALAARGGVVGIVFHPGFLDADARAEEARVRALERYTAIPAGDPGRAFVQQQALMRAEARPLPAARLVEHVLHAVEVAGAEHVGIGSDYDGIERGPQWLEDASCYGVLAELLLRAGLAEEQVGGILGDNLRRVFAATSAAGA